MASRPGRPANSGSWQKGKSGNPGGRPGGPAAVMKAILAETRDGAELVEFATELLRNTGADMKDRQWAHQWLSQYGLGKPLAPVDLHVDGDQAARPVNLSAIPIEERRAVVAGIRRARELSEDPGDAGDSAH